MPKVTQAHKETRYRQILDAARICMADNGFHSTSMADICRTSGLSRGAVYTYFSSKEEILEAMAEDGLRSNEQFFHQVRHNDDRYEGLLELFRLVFDDECCGLNPYDVSRMKIGLWAEGLRSPEVGRVFERSYRAAIAGLAGILREGQAAGQIRNDRTPEAAAQLLVSILEGFTLQRAYDSNIDGAGYLSAVESVLASLFADERNGTG